MSKKVLFLTTVLPRNQRMGGEVASQAFIDGLTQCGYQVFVVGYMRPDDSFALSETEIVIGKRPIETKKAKLFIFLWLLFSLIQNLPYSAQKYFSRHYINTVRHLTNHNDYDLIIIEHAQLGWLGRYISPKEKIVAIAQNIEHEIYLSNAKATKNPIIRWIYQREARLIKAMEDRLACTSAATWTLTEYDAKYFAGLPGTKAAIPFDLPPGLKLPDKQPTVKHFDIGLIGSWAWRPNEEGLRWFLSEVYPHLSEVTIHVAGRGADWLEDQYPNLTYRGFVPDAQAFMAQARVVAIPTLSGGGVQIKTLDAIASGSAVVATPIALRGISQIPDTVRVAEQPTDFAELLQSAIATTTPETSDIAAIAAREWFKQRCDSFIAALTAAIDPMISQH